MIADIMREAEIKMANAVEYTKEEFAAIRTGRAHPAIFAKLTADYYGSPTPLQQLATFHVQDARIVLITPYDRSAMANIELNFQVDGEFYVKGVQYSVVKEGGGWKVCGPA